MEVKNLIWCMANDECQTFKFLEITQQNGLESFSK